MTLRIAGIKHALIVAPHPDDEIIGAAALILTLRQRGVRVAVVIVSDGAASHPASRQWPAKRLIAARRRESVRSLRRLDVPAGQVRFLGLPDGALSENIAKCRRLLRRTLRQHPALDMIVGPAASDAHPDHRAVSLALAGPFGRTRRLTYQIWPPRYGAISKGKTVPMRNGHSAKRSLIRVHRTQFGTITDDPTGFAIARHELTAFAHPRETFVEVSR